MCSKIQKDCVKKFKKYVVKKITVKNILVKI